MCLCVLSFVNNSPTKLYFFARQSGTAYYLNKLLAVSSFEKQISYLPNNWSFFFRRLLFICSQTFKYALIIFNLMITSSHKSLVDVFNLLWTSSEELIVLNPSASLNSTDSIKNFFQIVLNEVNYSKFVILTAFFNWDNYQWIVI